MKKILLLSLFILTGCSGEPAEIFPTDNPDFEVEFLFEHAGCKIYRFRDGYKQYFAKCEGHSRVSYGHNENCGKNCNHTVYKQLETAYE